LGGLSSKELDECVPNEDQKEFSDVMGAVDRIVCSKDERKSTETCHANIQDEVMRHGMYNNEKVCNKLLHIVSALQFLGDGYGWRRSATFNYCTCK
jgi:hypothetical protein